MSLASELSALSVELLNDPEFGRTVTHRVYTNAAYNPAAGTPSRTPTDYTLKAIVETTSYQNRPDGKDIKTGDKIVHLAAADITVIPKVGQDQVLIIDGETWNIVSAPQDVSIAGTDILYSIVVRR